MNMIILVIACAYMITIIMCRSSFVEIEIGIESYDLININNSSVGLMSNDDNSDSMSLSLASIDSASC